MKIGFVTVQSVRDQLGDKLDFTFQEISTGIYYAHMSFKEHPAHDFGIGRTFEGIKADLARSRKSTVMYEREPKTAVFIHMFREMMKDPRFPYRILETLKASNTIEY